MSLTLVEKLKAQGIVVTGKTVGTLEEGDSKKEKVNEVFDLKHISDGTYIMSNSIFTAIPDLENKGVGIKAFGLKNEETGESEIIFAFGNEDILNAVFTSSKMKPEALYQMRGEEKTRKFKYEKLNLLGDNLGLPIAEGQRFMLEPTEVANLRKLVFIKDDVISRATISVPEASIPLVKETEENKASNEELPLLGTVQQMNVRVEEVVPQMVVKTEEVPSFMNDTLDELPDFDNLEVVEEEN